LFGRAETFHRERPAAEILVESASGDLPSMDMGFDAIRLLGLISTPLLPHWEIAPIDAVADDLPKSSPSGVAMDFRLGFSSGPTKAMQMPTPVRRSLHSSLAAAPTHRIWQGWRSCLAR